MEPGIIIQVMPTIAAYLKTATGAPNNAAWLICLEAHDHIQRHPNYRHGVRRAYRQALEQLHIYERRLLHSEVNRLSRLSDLPDDKRKQFGDISDRDYYDMWTATGAAAYEQTRPLITSLWNKYRVSLIQHDVPNAAEMAWPMVAQSALELACKFYHSAIDGAQREWDIPKSILNKIFGQLCLEAVRKEWKKALTLTDPNLLCYELSDLEERNITLGIQQLEEKWASPDIIIGTTYAAVKDYRENFASKAEHHMAMKKILAIKKGYTEAL